MNWMNRKGTLKSPHFQIGSIQASVLFFLLTVYIATPALFGQAYITSEDHVLFFSSAFDLTLFYPGSNRILSIFSFLTSWAGTIPPIANIQFWLMCLSISFGLLCLLKLVVPRLGMLFFLSSVLCITLFFGGWYSYYSLQVSQPYSYPFGISLISASWLSSRIFHGKSIRHWEYLIASVPIILVTWPAAGSVDTHLS